MGRCAAAESGCAIPADDRKDDDSESVSMVPLGEEAAPALELTLVLALTLRSPERFRMAIGWEEAEDVLERRENRLAICLCPR